MREYEKLYAKDFLKKAKIFLEIAQLTADKYPTESAFNAIQSTINANDAFTISILGKRASADHREAVLLHKEAAIKIGNSMSDILDFELDRRSITGYDVKKYLRKEDAALLIKRAKHFLDWVDKIIKEEA